MDVGVATAEPVPTPSQPRRGWTRGWGAKSWPVVLLFVVVTGILYWRPLIGRGDFLPTDILRPQPPWNTAQTLPQAPYNWILGDTLDNYTDVEYFVSQAKAGRLTHWNPYVASGVPLYQAPNYYPLNFLFYLLPMPYAWGAHAALRTFLAMLFMFLFLRQLKVRQWSAGLGGVAFGLTGFNVVWLGWQQSWVSVFIPALFWTAERVIQRPTGRRACGLGLVWAAMVLGGFPAVAGMSVYLLAGYTALRLWQTRRSEGSWARPARAVLWLAGGFVLGTLLTGVYTVPFLDFYAHADLGYRSSLGRLTLDPRYLVTALVPNAYGHEYLPNDWWGPSSNYVEIQFYGGILTLLLAASSLLLRRRDPDGPGRGLSWLFLGTCAVVVMLAFGHPLGLLDTVSKLPIFSNSAPGRLRALYGFALAACAGFGAHAWSLAATGDVALRRYRWAWLIGAAVSLVAVASAALLLGFGSWHSYVLGVRANLLRRYTVEQFGIAGLFFGAGVLLLLGILRRWWSRSVLDVGGALLVAADLLIFAYPIWPVTPHQLYYPVTPAHRAEAALVGDGRVLPLGWAFYPNSGTVTLPHVRDTRGHAFYTATYRAVLTAVDPNAFSPSAPTQPYIHPQTADLASPWLDRLSVHLVALDAQSPPIDVHPVGAPPPTVATIPVSGTLERPLPAQSVAVCGIRLFVTGAVPLSARVVVSLLDPAGSVVASAIRPAWMVRGGSWDSWVMPTMPVQGGGWRVRIAVTGGTVSLGGVAPLGGLATPALEALTPDSPTIEPVYGSDLVLYARSTSLPRARVVGSWRVQASGVTVAQLSHVPASAPVVLDRRPAGATASTGAHGTAVIVSDTGDTVRVQAHSDAPGELVLADSYYPGWTATVNGTPVPVAKADLILRAVPIPAGASTVVFRFAPPSIRRGQLVTLLGALLLALTAALSGRRVRWRRALRRRTRHPAPEVTSAPQSG